MEEIALSAHVPALRGGSNAWQDIVRKMIHNVSVSGPGSAPFRAYIAGRRYGDVSCTRFWSTPHKVSCSRETYANSGGAGYLLSWQLEGQAVIEQAGTSICLMPGSLAIVDGRRPMSVLFSQNVRRMVAKLPVHAVETALPALVAGRPLSFTPQGGLANMLLAYLEEIADTGSTINVHELPLLAENLCNLLKISAAHEGVDAIDSRQLRRRAIEQHLRAIAPNPDISLAQAAAGLNISPRLLQKELQGMDTSFTRLITEARLSAAAAKLRASKSLSVSDVAYHSGFNDISHFNHLFKRAYGMSPSAYRASAGSPAP